MGRGINHRLMLAPRPIISERFARRASLRRSLECAVAGTWL